MASHFDTSNREPVIETVDLTKKFGSFTAVDSLNLTIPPGQCYAFLGRNGAGKSTTARMMLDFIRPTKGTSRVLGGRGSDPEVRGRIGYLPGDLNLPRSMTGADAISYFGGFGGRVDRKEVDALVERFQLNPDRAFRHLSTGNRRKVGLVLAFMTRPELLILDEPTSGLDPVLQEEFRDLVAERKADGATVWLTSHVMAEVERLADRVGLVRDGKLARELTLDELRHQATGELRLTFAHPVPADALDRVRGVTGTHPEDGAIVVSVDGPVTDLMRRAVELDVSEVETEQRSLDDIFLDMFAEKGART